MDTPFPFSQYVTGNKFIGRKQDVTLLGNLLSQGEHVSIYEPPKTGKSSLIQQTLFSLKVTGRSFTVGQFSAMNIRTQEEFLLRLGSTVLKMVGSSPAEFEALVKQYLDGTHFVFDTEDFTQTGQAVSLGWPLDKEDTLAMLRLPFAIADDRQQRMILIIEEFHCIGNLEDPDSILRPLSAVIKEKKGRNFSFLFSGSAVNAMSAIFSGSVLFSRRVERVKLSPAPEEEVTEHLHRGFLSSGKVVEKRLLQGVYNLFRGHLWYINHLIAIADSLSRGYIMEPLLVEALESLVSIHEPSFRGIMNSLTTHQVSLLKATLDGVTRFSASDVIRRYGLNSSANVKRVKEALMKKEVIMLDAGDNPVLEDPLFEYWVRKYFFEMKE
ncbi:MAG: hypothetical protein IK052_03720 [Bacteroidales bacterium]|nr:hypothetical protein [Bacteroidales bacterium]